MAVVVVDDIDIQKCVFVLAPLLKLWMCCCALHCVD